MLKIFLQFAIINAEKNLTIKVCVVHAYSIKRHAGFNDDVL